MDDFPIPRRGESMTMACIYYWCTAIIQVVPTTPSGSGRLRAGRHIIKAHPVGSRYLTGQCPASNMYYPIDTATLEHLMERRNQDYPKVSQAVADLEWKRMHPGDTNRNESQSHRGPHRIGREPEPDSPDWALGGREDEDVRDQRTDVTGEVPLTTGGYPITGRGTGMTSIPELSAAVNGARAISAEAAGMLSQVIQAFDDHLHFQEIIEKLQEAVGAHSQIMDGVGSESGSLMAANGKLIAAIAHVEEAQQACGQALMDCAAARQAVSGSHEDDDRFIHGIHSV